MTVALKHFVVCYHRQTGAMVYQEYDDMGEAFAVQQRAEKSRSNPEAVEVALLSSKDLATLQQTHSRYFFGQWCRSWAPGLSPEARSNNLDPPPETIVLATPRDNPSPVVDPT